MNAFAVALHPGKQAKGKQVLQEQRRAQGVASRVLRSPAGRRGLQAIVAFGDNAHAAYDLWAASNPAVAAIPVVQDCHIRRRSIVAGGNDAALKKWTGAVTKLRGLIRRGRRGQCQRAQLRGLHGE